MLIVGTLGVQKQLSYLKDRDLGFNPEQVLIVHKPVASGDDFWNRYDLFKREVMTWPAVTQVSTADKTPGSYGQHVERFKFSGAGNDGSIGLKFQVVDYGFDRVFQFRLLGGRSFDPSLNDENAIVINRSAAMTLGLDPMKAVGNIIQQTTYSLTNREFKVIGVTEDFNQEALSPSEATVFVLDRHVDYMSSDYFCIRLRTDHGISETVDHISGAYEEAFHGSVFEFFFLEDQFNRAYREYEQFNIVFAFFALVAMILASIGLVGLTLFSLLRAAKATAIRRVLGASKTRIISAKVAESLLPVLVAFLIVFQPVKWLLENWLQGFHDRVTLGFDLFVTPVIGLMLVTTTVAGVLTWQQLRQNPTEKLNAE